MKREEASEIINSYFFYTVLPRCNGKVVNSRKLEEARPSGLFGRHSLSQELIEYITAPTFEEAICYGKKE